MEPASGPRVPTGVGGFDEILGGGLLREGLYLVKGAPGTGKTTLALQFLMEGVRRGEPAVYITLSETEVGIRASARSHGWTLEGIAIHELGSIQGDRLGEEQYTLFHADEVELGELTRKMISAASGTTGARIVVDSLSELMLLAKSSLQYRRQFLTLAQVFTAEQATVLLLDEVAGPPIAGPAIESLARGVIHLEQWWPELGDVRHRLRVIKMRGAPFRGGYHDYTIQTGGLAIYPRLRVADHHADFAPGVASSGVPGLDALLGGGFDRGATALLSGPTGSGKSVLATQIAVAAADRGEHVALFVFDEMLESTFARADGLGSDLRAHARSGRIAARQIDPGELAPWQFARAVLQAAERDKARVIVIDSINGYLSAMPDERALDIALHELFGCLGQLGVITVGTLVQHGILGERTAGPPVDVSYLSDTVVLLSLFEARGELRKAVSVVKRRRGAHEHAIRELHVGPASVRVGERLDAFHGLLTGVPTHLAADGSPREDDEPEDG